MSLPPIKTATGALALPVANVDGSSVGASDMSVVETKLDTIDATLQLPSAQLPAALGEQAKGGSVAIVVATDDAQFGADATGVAAPTGGSGLRGWLSGMYKALTTRLPAALGITTASASLSIAPASDAVFRMAGATAALVDRSGTITVGGSAQNIATSNASRSGYMVQNLSGTEDLWVSTVGVAVATQPAIRIPPNAIFSPDLGGAGTGAISLLGATTGHVFTAREW